MNVLITGASGLIGTRLIEDLTYRGEVYITSRRHYLTKYPVIYGDISSEMWLENAYDELKGKDIQSIVHLAAQSTVWRSVSDPAFDARNNILATINMLKLGELLKINKFIYCSSESVFGTQISPNENSSKSPVNPYGISKTSCENYVNFYKNKGVFESAIIRPSFVLGPNVSRNIVFDISSAIKMGQDSFELSIHRDSKFNFVDVRTVSDVIIDLLDEIITEEEINIVGHQNYTVSQVCEKILGTLHARLELCDKNKPVRIACLSSIHTNLYDKYQRHIDETLVYTLI